MNIKEQPPLFYAGLFIALGLMLGGFFISKTMYNSKVAVNTAEAKGLSVRHVTANRADWSISFMVKGENKSEVPELYEKAEAQQNTIVDLLKEKGFTDDEISIGVLDYNQREIRDSDRIVVDEVYEISGVVRVVTENVHGVRGVRSEVNKLIAQGIDIDNRAPKFYFTKLNEVKPDMLREATKNARIVADQFADNVGARVGGIQTARQGGFNITDAGEDRGDTKNIEKEVRVVTTITFYLK